MPIDPRRRDDIVAAVAAHDSANPNARLLAAMFPSEDVCQRSPQAIAEEGFNRKNLSSVLKYLVAAGFLSRKPGSGVVPNTYRLHLPPVRP